MDYCLMFLLCLLLMIGGLVSSIGSSDLQISEFSEISPSDLNRDGLKRCNSPARRSLLAPPVKHDTALVASLDGVVYLMDINSGKALWSFASGPPIYSSYQALIDHENDKENASGLSSNYFFDCDDDWELYVHRGSSKAKLGMTYEEFIRSTPYITDNGEITLGSKKTTVFLIDAKTGTLINTFKSGNSPSALSMQKEDETHSSLKKDIEEWVESSTTDVKKLEQPLYITRADYALESFCPKTGKVLWNLTVAEIRAAFLCQKIENPLGGSSFNLGNELGSENDGDFEMPLPCQTMAFVHRIHDPRLSGSLRAFGGLPKPHLESIMLPLPASDPSPSLAASENLPVVYRESEGKTLLPLLPSKVQTLGASGMSDRDRCENTNSCVMEMDDASKGDGVRVQHSGKPVFLRLLLMVSPASLLFVSILVLCMSGFILYWHSQAVKGKEKLKNEVNDVSVKAVVNKRKKARRSANSRNSSNSEKKDRYISSENAGGEINGSSYFERNDSEPWASFANHVEGFTDGRKIGKLVVSNKEIAKGSNGTVVLEGIYDGRPVAVKRLVQTHNDVALKEIQNLIASDRHPNIVRWYGVEYDVDFIYLSLERCTCSLNDLIQIHSNWSTTLMLTGKQAMSSTNECNVHLDSVKGMDKGIELWKADGYPASQLIKLLRDMISGLAHLHELGIIHRDLKPQNVLIVKEKSLCAKLSDMGISKRLVADMSSLSQHATGHGSSGWQAPEQLLHGRQTRAVDMFSLGCVLFFCITGGRHPFGEHLERDVNIVNNKVDLFLVDNIPEAVDLLTHLLDPNPELRPKAADVLNHPLFWNSEMRLSFLRDASDRVELEDREEESDLLKALECIAPLALGGKWDEKMETAFIANIGRYRRYKYDSVRDLLRVIRNKLNHYRELPQEIQELLGPMPEGFDGYFANRFPRFLIEVYKVIMRYCRDEKYFLKYLKSNLV